MGKKWLVITIIIVAVVLVLAAIPTGFVLAVNNSTYDCSFEYTKTDNLVNDIARKHLYYSAADKTVSVELNQDMLNSLIKDNMGALKLDLPKNVAIKEVLFNTKDQRLYVNAKYGSINTPISVKINVKILDNGLELTASDLKLGKMDAPGFVKKQIPADSMKYTVKYEDFGIPQIFAVKDIKFGSGVLNATIQLDEAKVVDLIAGYRADLMKQVDSLKAGQSELVSNFLTKFLGTGVLSEAKVKEYVTNALNNEELVNSAKYFATAGDLSKYTNSLNATQKKIMDWAAPLQVLGGINLSGGINSIDTAKEILTNDQKLRDFLTWFLTPDKIDSFVATINDYYGMYQDYYGMYNDLIKNIDKSVRGVKMDEINDYVKAILESTAQAEDARKYVYPKLRDMDENGFEPLVNSFEKDPALAKEYVANLKDARKETVAFLKLSYTKELKEFDDALKDRQTFANDLVKKLKSKKYEQALSNIQGSGIIGKKTQTFIDTYSKEIDFNALDDLTK